MTGFEDESLTSEFVAESREHLNAIEPDLLEMERVGAQASQEVLNRVFRAIHSIKGGAGFLAFDALKRLSHVMESVFMLIRDGKRTAEPDIMDVLLRSVDRLRAMIDDIDASQDVFCDDVVAQLETILSGKPAAASAAAPASPAAGEAKNAVLAPVPEATLPFDLTLPVIREALSQGMRFYEIKLNMPNDLRDAGLTAAKLSENIDSVGKLIEVIVNPPEIGALSEYAGQECTVQILFGTVLEADLAAVSVDLPQNAVTALDTAAIKAFVRGDASSVGTLSPGTPANEHALGQVLVKDFGANPLDVQKALDAQKDGNPAPLGNILVQQGIVSSEGVEKALEVQAEKRGETQEAKAAVAQGAETLRVRVDLLTRLMNTAGELVLGRNQILRALESHADRIGGLRAILQNIDRVTTELQEGIMQTRMQPIGVQFGRFPRVVRDMARNLSKEIDLRIEGAEVELDKSIIELLADPLTHLVRNCADHALETPEERVKAGKRRVGQVVLRAYHEGGQVNVSISDDGRGIDPRKVLRKALERGLVQKAQAEKMSEREIINLIFAPGFSTAETVSDISGRGVGMDVVRTNIERLGGHVHVESAVGEGTTVLLRLPLTLAIIPSLIASVSGQRFAVPQVSLVELVWVRAAEVSKRIEVVHGARVLRLRDKLLPLVHLADVLGLKRIYNDPNSGEALSERRDLADRRSRSTEKEHDEELDEAVSRGPDRRESWHGDYNILVLQIGQNQFGIVVDEVLDSEEVVVKPLSSYLKDVKCFAGATILGDGNVIMILDIGGIAESARLRFVDVHAEERRRQEEETRKRAISAAARRSVVIFTSARDEYFAVPQDRILRLEQVSSSSIERIGEKEFMQYRGAPLPLVRLDRHLAVKPLPEMQDSFFLIVPKPEATQEDAEVKGGIMVSAILDALDVEVQLQPAAVAGPGLQGAALVQDRLTTFLDPVAFVGGVCGNGSKDS